MPLYEYSCSDCGHSWEEVYSIEERHKPLSEPCPACKKEGTVYKGMAIKLHHGVLNPLSKMDENFKSEMKRIKKEHPQGFKNSSYF